MRGLLAAIVLTALVAGLPWALTRFVGWPLPDHPPSWAEIQSVLLGPMTTAFLLDFLACAGWLVWALFTLDVARCAIEIARGVRLPNLTATGPLHRTAAVLVSAILISILGHRTAAVPVHPSGPGPVTGPETVLMAPAWHPLTVRGSAGPPVVVHPVSARTTDRPAAGTPLGSVVVLAPDPDTGVHDSLWRIAERSLGDGHRWPEIFALNKGKPQPDGGVFVQPSLIFPGEEFALPPNATGPGTTVQPPLHPGPDTSPPTTTRPNPTTTPVPVTPAPLPTTRAAPTAATAAPDRQDPIDSDPSGAPGIGWGTEVLVGSALAAAVSAALLLARRRHRARYRPGSGDRTDLPIAPVIYQLNLAHLRADQDDPDSEEAPGQRPWRGPGLQVVAGPDESNPLAPAPALAVGVRAGEEVALDVAATHGLGLIGPGAAAAVRALIVTALTTTTGTTRTAARVIVVADDLAGLLVSRAGRPLSPPALQVVADLDAALDVLEAETLLRARSRPHTHDGQEAPVLLAARTPERRRQRLQAVLDNGSTVGVMGLLLGQWAPGVTAYVRDDGIISTVSPGPGEALRGTRVFRLGDDATADLLALLHHAAPDAELDHHADPGEAHAPEQERVETDQEPHPVAFPLIDTDLEILGELPVDAPGQDDPVDPLLSAFTAPWPEGTGGAATEVTGPGRDLGGDGIGPGRVGDAPDAAAVPVRITVLGPPRVLWRPAPAEADTDVVEYDITSAFQPRVRELLVFLALHPHGAGRVPLIAALWATSPPEKTTSALNSSLTRLRHAVSVATEGTVPDVVLVNESRFRLDPGLVGVDYHRFVAAAAARRAARTDQQRIDAYREVVDSYTGPVADGLDAEWIDTAREAIRRDAIDAVAALARALVDEDPQQTLDLLEVARAFDPHNELIYRDIMRLQERLGRHDAIARTMTLLTTRLAEVGDQPALHTVDLADRLRHRHGSPTLADRAENATSTTG